MKTRLAAAGAILLLAGSPASAHRLDEYLQATIVSVEKDRVQMQIRLAPGVAVFPTVLASIDTDANGVISEAEQRAYAERVLGDLSLTIDDNRLQLRLVSSKFAKLEELKEGLGEIQLEFEADVPRGGPNRRLIFDNQHQSRISVYLVNCLVPRDPDIRVTAQDRNYQQSFYELDYVQTGARSSAVSASLWSSPWGWLGTAALLLFLLLLFLLFLGLAFVWRRRRVIAANEAVPQGVIKYRIWKPLV